MTLEQVFRLLWTRKLAALIRVKLPLPLLMTIATLAIAGVAYYWLASLFEMLTTLDGNVRLQLLYAVGLLVSMLPILFSLIRSLSLRGMANESITALPFIRGQWIRAATHAYYLTQSPILAGVLTAVIIHIAFKGHLGAVGALGLILLLIATAASLMFAAMQVTAWILAQNRSAATVGITVGYAVISLGIILGLYRLYAWQGPDAAFWHVDVFVALAICALFVVVGCIAIRRFRRYAVLPLELADDSVRSGVLTKGSAKRRVYDLFWVIQKVILRDKRFWVVLSVNTLLASMMAGVGLAFKDANTDNFFVSFLPVLLILGQATIAAEARGLLGVSRESMYVLPFSARQVVVALQLTAFCLIAGVVVLFLPLMELLLGHSVQGASLIRLLCISLLAAQVACLTSVLFFESRRDASRGLLAGAVLFVMLWPVLALNGWLASRSLAFVGLVTVLIAAGLFQIIWLVEKRMLFRQEAA